MSALGLSCLIALEADRAIPSTALGAEMGEIAPRASVTVAERASADALQALAVTIDRQEFVCALFDGQMPDTERKRGGGMSLFWAGASAALERHGAFVAVSAVEHETTHGLVRAQAAALTRLTAALCRMMEALGIIWVGAPTAASPEQVLRAVRDLDHHRWPVDVWIGCLPHPVAYADSQRLALRTQGLARFLGFELEIEALTEGAADGKTAVFEPVQILFHTARWLIEHGNVIQNGQSIEVKGQRTTTFHLRPGPDGEPGLAELRAVPGETAPPR